MAQLRANTGLRLVRHGQEMLLEGSVAGGVSPHKGGRRRDRQDGRQPTGTSLQCHAVVDPRGPSLAAPAAVSGRESVVAEWLR